MIIVSSVKSALISMLANKTRTILTVLGVVIGISSVIIVYSAGHGIERLIVGQVESFGTNVIQTEIKVPTNKKISNTSTTGVSDIVQGVQITTLTLDDMNEIKELPNIKDAYAGVMSQEAVTYLREQKKAFILGTSASYIEIDKSEIKEGRFFTKEEDKSLARVAVLGYKMKEKLFGESDTLGKMIKIRKTKFRVIGVMEERGAIMGMDFDDFIYLPVRSLQKRIMGIDYLMYFLSEVNDMNYAEDTANEMRMILRDRHDISVEDEDDFHKDDFRVATMIEMMDLLGTVTGAITLLLLAIVAISLVVGGVGILNIMYVVVSERTAEIGLRKAVGATYRDIISQFLLESVLITILGGIFGVILGVILSWLLSYGANYAGFDWEFAIPLESFVVALGFSTFFGLAFGLYPARKAAKLQPVEALRAE
ncbi:MAG: ABC transporter permease [Patescibacteria group bacterium]|nr:ABC transporter permease [Patescibacteria group bacterium]